MTERQVRRCILEQTPTVEILNIQIGADFAEVTGIGRRGNIQAYRVYDLNLRMFTPMICGLPIHELKLI